MDSTGQFPNETYVNGLRDNPDSTLAVVYDEFRQPLIMELTALGATEPDAAWFFQIAVIDVASLIRNGHAPAGFALPALLEAYCFAHYRDWLTEQGEPIPESLTESPEIAGFTSPDLLRKSRQKAVAWNGLSLLDIDCRQTLMEQPDADETDAPDKMEALATCLEQYKSALELGDQPATELPEWAKEALSDPTGFKVWQRTQTLERLWAAGQPDVPESNQIWRWAIAALLIAVVGYGTYQFYFRPKTAAEVFADNFKPPASLMEDLDSRYGAEMGNDSVSSRPNTCMQLMREADVYYRAKDYQSALDPLLLIVLDSNSICQSDAWYFLGIIQLQVEDPATAIQCFAKIEDLNRYGEDLYWYQALAFVQLAKENPLMRDKARRAVERTLGNTREPKRRARAEEMLKNLSQ